MFRLGKLISLFAVMAFAVSAFGFEGRVPSEYNLPGSKLAIQGYDPVAYFPEGGSAATKGLAELEIDFEGVKYRFATSENMQLFLSNPDKYEPAYGGWCATAMAFNSLVNINPLSFVVKGNRLFLFSAFNGRDARDTWNDDPRRLERRADRNWERRSGEDPTRGL